MATPIHSTVFADVINDLLQELDPIALGTDTIFRLIINNVNSPVLAEIQHLALPRLEADQMTALVPALAKMVQLTSLSLSWCTFSPDHLKFLFAECPALSKLQSLDLGQARGVRLQDLLLLSQSTTLVNLTSLNLTACALGTNPKPTAPQRRKGFSNFGSFGDAGEPVNGLVALFSSPVVKNLTHLNLRYAGIDDPLVHITIATSPHLTNLVSLDLSGNNIKSEAVAAFAASTTLANITHLNLSDSSLGDKLVAQLFSPPSLLAKKLQSVNLGSTSITVSSIELLLNASPHLTELLVASNTRLEKTGVQFIATSMPALTKLNLSDCSLYGDAYAALAASTTLTNLRELDMRGNPSYPIDSIITLVNSPAMTNLTSLDLSDTHKGPKVLAAIAQSPAMAKLQHLKFGDNDAGDLGLTALAQSTTLTNLTSLELVRNNIGPTGIQQLCSSPVASKLTHLRLMMNDLGNSIATVLAAPSSTMYCLTDLILIGVRVGDEGVSQLLKTPHLDQLDSLMLNGYGMSKSTKAAYEARFRDSGLCR